MEGAAKRAARFGEAAEGPALASSSHYTSTVAARSPGARPVGIIAPSLLRLFRLTLSTLSCRIPAGGGVA